MNQLTWILLVFLSALVVTLGAEGEHKLDNNDDVEKLPMMEVQQSPMSYNYDSCQLKVKSFFIRNGIFIFIKFHICKIIYSCGRFLDSFIPTLFRRYEDWL